MRLKWVLASVAAFAAAVLASSTSAATYNLTITGRATAPCPTCGWISQYFPEASSEFSPFTATFTFETDLPPEFTGENLVDFSNPVTAATFAYAGGFIDFGAPNSSYVNYFADIGLDGVNILAGHSYSLFGPNPNISLILGYVQPPELLGLTPANLTCPTPDCGGGRFNMYLDSQRRSEVVNLRPETFTLSAAAVPEPATWAIMIAGFGMVGFALRYRRGGLGAVRGAETR